MDIDIDSSFTEGGEIEFLGQRMLKDKLFTAGVRLYFNEEHHDNFLGYGKHKRHLNNRELAELLTSGTINSEGIIPARDLFKPYIDDRFSYIEERFEFYFNMARFRSYTMDWRLTELANDIKYDLIHWVREGNVQPYNGPAYLKKKLKAKCGDSPFIATGELLISLEVDVYYE